MESQLQRETLGEIRELIELETRVPTETPRALRETRIERLKRERDWLVTHPLHDPVKGLKAVS